MKNLFVLMMAACLALPLAGQIRTPAASPGCKLTQTVGLMDVTIDYSRPSMKGRNVYGELVPFDNMWRTGANSSSKVTFSGPVKIGGKDVAAGTYSLLTIPGKSSWTVIFYSDANFNGTGPGYDQNKDAARVQVSPIKLKESVETFTIGISDIGNTGANLVIDWENTRVAVPFEATGQDEKILKDIDRVMAGPGAGDYYNAARYYFETDRELDKALSWINKSLEMREAYWVMTLKARIQGKMKDYAGAIATSEKALGLAQKDNNPDYVKINQELIAEFKKANK